MFSGEAKTWPSFEKLTEDVADGPKRYQHVAPPQPSVQRQDHVVPQAAECLGQDKADGRPRCPIRMGMQVRGGEAQALYREAGDYDHGDQRQGDAIVQQVVQLRGPEDVPAISGHANAGQDEQPAHVQY